MVVYKETNKLKFMVEDKNILIKGALNVTGSKWYTTYTDEMKALKTAYSQTNNIDQRTLYMFVMKKAKTDDETNSKTIVGDMPRGKQFGFLFTEGVSNKEQLAKTIAHELGHGYFQLKHPFEMGLKQGNLKDNLMDYDQGVAFNKYEWDLMHDPGIVTGLFESDSSGMIKLKHYVELIIGKPYIGTNGKEHPYGHAALRVYNEQEKYNMVYDFGRYGNVESYKIAGEGIMNVYDNGDKYIEEEMRIRNSVGYTLLTSVEQEKTIITYFKNLTTSSSIYKTEAGKISYKLPHNYNIFTNNCLTTSNKSLLEIGWDWLNNEYDPREALKIMEENYKALNLTRTEYNQGENIKVTFEMQPIKKIELNINITVPPVPADNTISVKPILKLSIK